MAFIFPVLMAFIFSAFPDFLFIPVPSSSPSVGAFSPTHLFRPRKPPCVRRRSFADVGGGVGGGEGVAQLALGETPTPWPFPRDLILHIVIPDHEGARLSERLNTHGFPPIHAGFLVAFPVHALASSCAPAPFPVCAYASIATLSMAVSALR